MNSRETVRFFLRKPKFPVLVDVDGVLICGKSAAALSNRIEKAAYKEKKTYDAIDSTGEGWRFYPEHWVLSPLTLKKRWTKLEIIRLYNERKNREENASLYPMKSLSSKRLDKIIRDVTDLLN